MNRSNSMINILIARLRYMDAEIDELEERDRSQRREIARLQAIVDRYRSPDHIDAASIVDAIALLVHSGEAAYDAETGELSLISDDVS